MLYKDENVSNHQLNMNKDKLENFISQNREAFDSEFPSMNLWSKIEEDLNPTPKKKNWKKIGGVVVIVSLLVALGIWQFVFNKKQGSVSQSPIAYVNVSPSQELLEKNPELAELSSFYTQKINTHKNRLIQLQHKDPDLLQDLEQMESMFDTLQAEWKRNPHKSDQELVQAMIANYRMRSTLLENVVKRVEFSSPHSRREVSVPAFAKE